MSRLQSLFNTIFHHWLLGAGLAGMTLASCYSGSAIADDDDATVTAAPVQGELAVRKTYPGGRDEQDLTVQAVLPAPIRTYDRNFKVGTEENGDDDANEVEAPAQHD